MSVAERRAGFEQVSPGKRLAIAGRAPDLAKGVYGAGAADSDKIRASEMLNKYCLGGAQLPAQAPKAPF